MLSEGLTWGCGWELVPGFLGLEVCCLGILPTGRLIRKGLKCSPMGNTSCLEPPQSSCGAW